MTVTVERFERDQPGGAHTTHARQHCGCRRARPSGVDLDINDNIRDARNELLQQAHKPRITICLG